MEFEEVQVAGDGDLLIRSPYVAWDPVSTRVVTFAIGVPAALPVRRGALRAVSSKAAREHAVAQWGQILEENAAGDYIFLRVRK